MEHAGIYFKNVVDENIRECFLDVIRHYPLLKQYDIQLYQKKIKASTMQAQPVIDLRTVFLGKKHYRINLGWNIRNRPELLVKNIPDEALKGWFAHELGHVVDYQRYSIWQMMVYGLKYLISAKFRLKTEHVADYIAIKHGFHDELIATKNYLLDHDLVAEKYKEKIRKYYLSVEEVMMCQADHSYMEPHISFLFND